MPSYPKTALPVCVIWRDAQVDPRVAGTPAQIAKTLKPAIRYSVGWLVSQDTRNVRVATDVDIVDGAIEYSSVYEVPSTLVDAILPLTRRRNATS